jgi:hypothetical protein
MQANASDGSVAEASNENLESLEYQATVLCRKSPPERAISVLGSCGADSKRVPP